MRFIEEAEVMRMEALVREKYEELNVASGNFWFVFPECCRQLSFGSMLQFYQARLKCSKIPGRNSPPLSPEFLSLLYRDAGLYLSKSGERGLKMLSQLEEKKRFPSLMLIVRKSGRKPFSLNSAGILKSSFL